MSKIILKIEEAQFVMTEFPPIYSPLSLVNKKVQKIISIKIVHMITVIHEIAFVQCFRTLWSHADI